MVFKAENESISATPISYDYIRGLVEGEGVFTFSTDTKSKRRVPAFSLRMHVRDIEVLKSIKDFLKLKNKIYTYDYSGKNGVRRGPQSILIIRELGSLKNIIIPLFHRRLIGHKKAQFEQWTEKIGNDDMVPKKFKFLHNLYKSGFFDKHREI